MRRKRRRRCFSVRAGYGDPRAALVALAPCELDLADQLVAERKALLVQSVPIGNARACDAQVEPGARPGKRIVAERVADARPRNRFQERDRLVGLLTRRDEHAVGARSQQVGAVARDRPAALAEAEHEDVAELFAPAPHAAPIKLLAK